MNEKMLRYVEMYDYLNTIPDETVCFNEGDVVIVG